MRNLPDKDFARLHESQSRLAAQRDEDYSRSVGGKQHARSLSPRDVARILNKIRHRLTLGQVCDRGSWD